MGIFAVSTKNRFHRKGGAGLRLSCALASGALIASLAICLPAHAQTIGNGGDATSLGVFGGIANPSDGKPVDLTTTLAGFIENPYIRVVSGIGGTFNIVFPGTGTTTVSIAYNSAGMLAIQNLIGSVRYDNDNNQPLVGDRNDVVTPYASQWETTNQGFINYDFPSYLRASVDGVVTNFVIFGNERFDENTLTLTGNATLNPNILIQQQVRLYRATAQLRWVMTNRDTVSHTVRLRYTANISSPFYYQDPERGVSRQPHDYLGGGIPTELFLYGNRYEPDNTDNGGPFASKFTFRDFGATLPARVQIADGFDLRPNAAAFDVTSAGNIERLAVGVYYGPYSLRPGESAEVVTYYGNGSVSERLNRDYVVASDGPESLGYNTAAALDPAVAGNPGGDTAAIAPKFLSPSPFKIYGSVYNRVPNTPSTSVTLNNVRASLTLPTGLTFATVPGTGQKDTSEKIMGNNGAVSSDRGSDVSWLTQATGDVYGALTYQVNVRTDEGGSRQISRTINIPALPFRSVVQSRYQMLGFPFEFDTDLSNNADPSTVLNGLTAPADTAYRFYRWIPDPNSSVGAGRYEVVNKLENGIGYMFRPSIARTVFAKGVRPYPKQATVGATNFADTNTKQVQLQRGWNIISNPYVYEIPLRYIRFATTSDLNNSQTFQQGVNSGLVQSGLFFLNASGNSYDFFSSPDTPLKPWEAYWIYITRPIVLVYQLPAQRNSVILPANPITGDEPATRKRGEVESGRVLAGNLNADEWRLQMVATHEGGNNDRAAVIGVTRAAKTDKNADPLLSVPKPPTPYSDYVDLSIKSADSKMRLAKDVRRAAAGETTWDVEVTADAGGKVTLTWPNIAKLPRRVSLVLKDKDSGRAYAMRSTSSATVNLAKGGVSRFVVTAKTQASLPLTITGLRTVSSSRAQGGYNFTFNLSRAASITATVTTINGKVMANLASGRAANAGSNPLHWTGRAVDGAALPPGPYMVHITAQGEDGEAASDFKPFLTIQ